MRLREAIEAACRGDLPVNIALMRLCMETGSPEEAQSLLHELVKASESPARAALLRRASDLPHLWPRLRAVASQVPHDLPVEGDALRHWAACFDRAAELSPEASVALYALGEADELATATDELVDLMRDWRLVTPDARVLDLGCGIGRLERALAPLVRSMIGLDVSARMIALARESCADLPNVAFHQAHSLDLSVAAGAFDLVAAIDVFPYIVQSGKAAPEHVLREISRVLAPGGRLLIMNFAYDGGLDDHRASLVRLAKATSFRILRNGTCDLRSWDGAAFLLEKSGPRAD